MAMTRNQWNRFQQDLPQEDRISYDQYLETLGDLQAIADNPQAAMSVVQNMTDAANAARIAARDADAADMAQANKDLAAADALAAEADKIVANIEAANNPVPVVNEETGIVEIKPEPTPVEKIMGPSRFSKDGNLLEFTPMTEGARLAIFGYNPATGKAYTDEESAALNGGYLPEGYRNLRGYRFDPTTGELEVLGGNGTTSGLGARYQMNAKGNIIPRAEFLPKGVGFDENGRSYQPGQRMPGETTAQYIGRLSQIGQGVLFENGKAYQYDSAGRFYIDGQQPMPEGFGQPPSGNQAVGTMSTGATTSKGLVTGSATSSNIKPIPTGVTVTTTYTDPKTGDTVGVLSNGTTQVLAAGDKLATGRASTIATLMDRFNKYGLGSLANKIQELAIDGATESTITLQLQETEEYQKRFSANAARIKQGLQVLNPAEYLSLEDGYRQVLRAYGLKSFDTDAYVQQFIANDVSAAELSNRVVTAVQRVQNADPAVQQQLRDYYGIGQQDLVAYVLDPQQQFQKIERQVASAEIGVAAGRQGLKPGVAVAEQLAAQGISQAEAQRGYATIADILPTAEKLSSIYGTTLDAYGQSEGEQEVFNQLASAQRKREKLTAREVAAFSGASGTNRTSLTTSNVGQFQNPERTYRPRQRNRPIVGASQFPRTELWPAN